MSFLSKYYNKISKITFIILIHFFKQSLYQEFLDNYTCYSGFLCSLVTNLRFFPQFMMKKKYLYIPNLEVYFFFERVWIFHHTQETFPRILLCEYFVFHLFTVPLLVLLWHYFRYVILEITSLYSWIWFINLYRISLTPHVNNM